MKNIQKGQTKMLKLENDKNYKVILYYHYTKIRNPEDFAAIQREFCMAHNLRGRIWVAEEGINGTVSGTTEAIMEYEVFLKRQPGMGSIHVKSDHCAGHVFPKLKVRVRKEIVCWRLDRDLNPSEKTGNYVTAQQFKKAMQERDTIILDGRNGYEYDLGHFRGAIRADIRTTREFPGWLRKHFRFPPHQRVVTYCTGGIRCEKLTAWLREEGYTNVAQLQGGIITYSQDEDTQGENFMGLCYTFDERKAIPVNRKEPHVIVGRCWHCKAPAETYIDCAYDFCHLQHIVCPTCWKEKQGFCTPTCAQKQGTSLPRPS